MLRPLPTQPYEFGAWKKARVAFDYHVCVEHCFYSVPYTLVSQEVDVRVSLRVVEIFHGSQRVASHVRSTQPNQQLTLALHMPVAHQAYQDWTPERLVKWARTNGPATTQLVAEMMRKHPHPQQGFRSCLGVMKLAREFGSDRCEAACVRALLIGSPCYQSIRSILTKKLDQTELPATPSGLPCPEHHNIRGAGYYRKAVGPGPSGLGPALDKDSGAGYVTPATKPTQGDAPHAINQE